MPCEDLHAELSAWIDGEVNADDRAGIAAHLQSCPACSDYVRALQDTSSLVRTLPTPRAPASVTQAAMGHARAMKPQAAAPSPRWRLSLAWPIPALGVGLVGLAAAIALAVFVVRPEGPKIPRETADLLHSGASSAASPMPNGAGYHLSSAPDSVTGSIAITRGYDFRSAQTRRDIGTFNARERFAWDHGVWRHERRFGRAGWWWDVEGAWYWYDKPAAGPPAIVSDIRFAADSAAAESTPQPPATSNGPLQPR
jgi:putative zinc finger protein